MLLESWTQSLRLLKPKNIKLFILVTLKGVLDICKRPREWSWLLCMLIITSGSSAPFIVASMSTCLFFLFLTARPSVSIKNIRYMRSYIFRYSSLVIIASIVLFIMSVKFYNMPLLRYLVYLVGPLAPLTVFTVLFLLDSKNSVKNIFKSVHRSIKFVLYNAPIIVLFYGVWILFIIPSFSYFLDVIVSVSHRGIAGYVWVLGAWYIFAVLITFPIVLFTNYYVKRVHDNFSLYE